MTGYEFEIGNRVYGWNAGAELKSRDGMFVVKYDVGHDKVNQTYQTVGGFVNVGFQPENLLRGESPFTMPEPIFRSPRSLWYMLTEKVKRDWHQPAAAIVAQQAATQQAAGGGRQPTFIFELVDKTNPVLGQTFNESTLTPLTTLTFDHTPSPPQAGATIYSVAIFDPDGVITTPTVPVTLTPNKGALAAIDVTPNGASGAYSIPGGVARDGTPADVFYTGGPGTPAATALGVVTFPATGTILIQGAGVQDLTITVTAQ